MLGALKNMETAEAEAVRVARRAAEKDEARVAALDAKLAAVRDEAAKKRAALRAARYDLGLQRPAKPPPRPPPAADVPVAALPWRDKLDSYTRSRWRSTR